MKIPLMRRIFCLVIMRRREMNMSASFSVWIAPKPAFSQLNSFISKFTTRVSEKCKLGRKL